MYPGFDTASSIALLAISALAKRGPNGEKIPPADIVILPVRNQVNSLVPNGTEFGLQSSYLQRG